MSNVGTSGVVIVEIIGGGEITDRLGRGRTSFGDGSCRFNIIYRGGRAGGKDEVGGFSGRESSQGAACERASRRTRGMLSRATHRGGATRTFANSAGGLPSARGLEGATWQVAPLMAWQAIPPPSRAGPESRATVGIQSRPTG